MSSELCKQTLEVAAYVIRINIDLRAHVISLRSLNCYYQSEERCGHLLHVALYSIINLSESSQKICWLKHVRMSVTLVLCCVGNLLEIGIFLREHPHIKVCILVWFKGGGNDQVFSRRKTKVVAHLSQVYEGLGTSCRTVSEEEVSLQVHIPKTRALRNGTKSPCNSLFQGLFL